MCGIVGFINTSHCYDRSALQSIARKMSDMLTHRGPDDGGVWVDEKSGIALGHRRLAIIDLSKEGSQPMISESGRYVIVYNGEIYNYSEICMELEYLNNPNPLKWRGHSDTEVMLSAVEKWGLKESVRRFNGMFAFALWDQKERKLFLSRDRLGEKPLYYGLIDKTFIFGSELKAFKAYPGFAGDVNRDALALYLRYSYIPSPHSIFKGIYKLSPGAILTIDASDIRSIPAPIFYWSAREIAEHGVAEPFGNSLGDTIDQFDALLRDSIKIRMISDVPLGAFFSGGVDSSSVISLMQAQSSKPVKTFTIGFHEAEYNEAEDAKAIAQYLGTEHTELYLTYDDAVSVIPDLPFLYDEPFSDSSQIPTYLVSRMARQHVTVSLSGDGGDELFAGYNRYLWCSDIWRNSRWMPNKLKRIIASMLTVFPPRTWDLLFSKVRGILPKKIQQRNPGDKLWKLAGVFASRYPEDMYMGLVSHWKNPDSIVIGAEEPTTILTDRCQKADFTDFTLFMMYMDLVTYLPDDILVKVDRASMGVSLEARLPFLDHRVVEFAWKIPLSMKIRDGKSKWLLRQVLYKYVPKELVERPKMGFAVPIDMWLRGPLKDWAESLLDESRLKREGFFRWQPIRNKWEEHFSGRKNWQHHLWDVLMFQAWLEKNYKNNG